MGHAYALLLVRDINRPRPHLIRSFESFLNPFHVDKVKLFVVGWVEY